MLYNFKKFDLDHYIGTCPSKCKIGHGHLVISFFIFASACFKISKKNNLKQKSYEDFTVLKIDKKLNIHYFLNKKLFE